MRPSSFAIALAAFAFATGSPPIASSAEGLTNAPGFVAAAPGVAASSAAAPPATSATDASVAPPAALTGPQVGAPAPAFSLRTLDGKTVSLESYRGKTLVLNVWATWCPPCRLEMPELISAYPAQHRNNVEFLGVDTTEVASLVKAYVTAKNVPYPMAIDAEKKFGTAYDVQYFPTTYVIDAQGVLRARYIDVLGPTQLSLLVAAGRDGRNAVIPSTLQAKIDALLGDPTIVFDGDAASIATNAKKAHDAIGNAEKATDDSDPAKGETVDLLRTRAEEAALSARAIDAFSKTATSDADKILLGSLQGDAAVDREAWDVALASYRSVLALDPKNEDALSGIALAAGRSNQNDVAVEADVKLSALHPDSVEPLVDLGIALAKAGRYPDAYATFDTATTLGAQKLKADPKTPKTLRTLAWAYLYEGRTHAKGGDLANARKAFERSLALAIKLPAGDIRHDMYLEENQEAMLALDLGDTHGTAITLAPWTGPELPGSVPNTIKYRLTVAGPAGRTIALHVPDAPRGWVASFCTDKICSPFRVNVDLPASGVKIVEFQLVPPDAKSPHPQVHVVATDGGKTTSAST